MRLREWEMTVKRQQTDGGRRQIMTSEVQSNLGRSLVEGRWTC